MKALIFKIRLNSLYSIRIPFTWQSALTYPLLPPSAVIGLIANAYQRHKNLNLKQPLKWFEKLENDIEWAGSRLLSPYVVKSYITSAITKWEINIGDKPTNALGREFGYTKLMEIMVIFKTDEHVQEILEAISRTPLTCGDSESPVSVVEKLNQSLEVKEMIKNKNEEVETEFPFPFLPEKYEIKNGTGRIYLVHEKCIKRGKRFPLVLYVFPVKEEKGIIYPEKTALKLKEEIKFYYVEEKNLLVFPPTQQPG